MEISQSRKRARPVVSCLRCREKKLKCDRVDPCENCIKAGHRANCAYNQHPTELPSKPKRVQLNIDASGNSEQLNGVGIGIIEDLQQRLARVEGLLAGQSANVPAVSTQNSWPSNATVQHSSLQSSMGTLVVKGSRSRYHGQNDRITLLNQFEEAKGFVNQCSKDSSIVKLAREVQFLQSKTQAPLDSPQSMSELESFPELLQLLQSLPSKSICDRLVAVYTNNFEKTLRVLHIPSFLGQYEHFWASPEDESYLSSPFIPQLTAILAVSIMLGEESIKMEDITPWEYLRLNAVGLLQAWLQKLPRKHRTELTTLQIETLVLLARQLRLTSAEESWKAAGSLVRSAMVMGLHIDLSGSTKMSVFQAESRRRLWITIAEMDLQASITSGMPIMTPLVDFHALSPANLNDADFNQSTTELPPPRPLDEPTDTLALVTLSRTLSHRVNAMNFIQQTGPDRDIDEQLKQGRILEECLLGIPDPLKIDHTLGSDTMPPAILNQVLLDLYIRRPLLCLYRPVSTGRNQDHTALQEIQQACLDSSLTILSYQDYFDPNLADLDAQNSNEYWDIFHKLCKNDVLWAALSVCDYMRQFAQQASITDQQSSNGFSDLNTKNQSHSKASLTRLVENTLESLSRRIGEAGNNVKDILLLAVVLQSVRGRGSPETKDRWMTQGAKRALSACRQYLLPAVTDQHSAFGVRIVHHTWGIGIS
ncbi:hypothetical protein N7508_004230 [Penicillium antarcticum]|uniref:uncharacterized protein n=1 Tax=Penicillium antarcticum TaxID=416450 RepID=UPI00239EAA06|nr:uncharacterized protein N7508_004230 [Penicillium antarcticum]KAJ5308851.1 hypothetical protein N7508_004230 [Penicillium antarcticum]